MPGMRCTRRILSTCQVPYCQVIISRQRSTEAETHTPLTIADSTRHWSHVIHRSGSFKDTSAEAIVEAPYSGGILPLEDFHTAHFTSAEINGGARTTVYAVDMVNASDTAYLDTVSSVTSGGAWSAYWHRSR